MLRYGGAGHSAALHARDAEVILRFGAAVNVLRVAVNSPCSTGAAGFDTHLAPTMTVGTGFFGRSAVAENLQPQHLVNWTKIAFDKQSDFDAQSFASLSTHDVEHAAGTGGDTLTPEEPAVAELREEIRRIIIEELRDAITGLKI